jgi:flagellar hook assembly protein FlgD
VSYARSGYVCRAELRELGDSVAIWERRGKSQNNNLKVYPNPTAQFLYIGKESDKNYKEITIIDMSGKLIMKKNDHKYNQAIDVSHLVPGNYIIVSKSDDGTEYKTGL